MRICPICSNQEFEKVLTTKDYSVSKKEFDIIKCKKCDLHITDPIPAEELIGQYYASEDYISHTNQSNSLINVLYKAVRQYTLQQKYKLIQTHSGITKGSILDIGAGTGHFLKQFLSKGWEVTGVEVDDKARQVAKQSNELDLLQDLPPSTINLQVITMWHVLEHVHNINLYMHYIQTHLANNGTAFVAVPNLQSYDAQKFKDKWAAYDVPRHLHHFSKNNMEALCAKHQLRIKSIEPMYFDSFYVSMLSNKIKYGSNRMIQSFLTGLRSNFLARKTNNYSSLIYIIEHA